MHLLKAALLSTALVINPFVLYHAAFANNLSEAEMERWLNSDDPNPPEFHNVEVNEGTLAFLNKKPVKPVHHHRNTLTLSATSLNDGWVKLEQCHHNMDRVPLTQVMFNKKRIRDIKITRADAIDKAWVENNSVQLENVKENATLCIEAWSKALTKNSDGSYHLMSGPFMRKFLDGYYPIHVTIEVNFKDTDLKLMFIEPVAQDGFNIYQTSKTVNMDAWFEGRLKTELTFTN